MLEAGRDYIAVRAIRSLKRRRWISLAMITLGALLLVSTVGYFGYAAIARSQLSELEYTVPTQNRVPGVGAAGTSAQGATPTAVGSDDPVAVAIPSSSFISLYPGKLLPGRFWDDPRWSDVDYVAFSSLVQGFAPLDPGTGIQEGLELPPPIRIEIPAISLDSAVMELSIVNLNDARAWETPKHVVGHIPATSNPGEMGNGYLFGHLQSPIKGEGSVFGNLPQIPGLLRNGETVYVVVRNDEGTSFLYQVVETRVVKATDFVLAPSTGATVTLVTCVPKYVYDHRLLVEATLVGVKT